jgi:hypothetical protein
LRCRCWRRADVMLRKGIASWRRNSGLETPDVVWWRPWPQSGLASDQ